MYKVYISFCILLLSCAVYAQDDHMYYVDTCKVIDYRIYSYWLELMGSMQYSLYAIYSCSKDGNFTEFLGTSYYYSDIEKMKDSRPLQQQSEYYSFYPTHSTHYCTREEADKIAAAPEFFSPLYILITCSLSRM